MFRCGRRAYVEIALSNTGAYARVSVASLHLIQYENEFLCSHYSTTTDTWPIASQRGADKSKATG
jgi:hypothetical protein